MILFNLQVAISCKFKYQHLTIQLIGYNGKYMNNQHKQKNSSKKKLNKKCKSQQIFKLTHSLKQKQEELSELKNKIQSSEHILTDIYAKVKRKQSMYQLQILNNQIKCDKLKSLARQYKNYYHQGIQLLQNSILQKNKKNNIKNFNDRQYKNKILQKIRSNRANEQRNKRNDIPKQTKNNPSFFCQKQIKMQKIQQTFIDGKQSRKTDHLSPKKYDTSKIHKSTVKNSKNTKQNTQIQNANAKKITDIQQKTYSNKDIKKIQNRSISLYDEYKSKIQVNYDQKQFVYAKEKSKKVIQQLQQELTQLKIVRKKSQMRLQQTKKPLNIISVDKQKQKGVQEKIIQSSSDIQKSEEQQQESQKLKRIQTTNLQRFTRMQSQKLNKMI